MVVAQARDWLLEAMERGRLKPVGPRDGFEKKESLSPQQEEAVERGVALVESFGGVLLADAVGLGKTSVALELVRRLVHRMRRRGATAEPPLFVVPARLRRHWEQAAHVVGWQPDRDLRLVSHHYLSRRALSGRPAVVVVDEAHRFRNPNAKRSRNLAKITARSPVILVTASPVCTSLNDLRQLLSYFLSDDSSKRLIGMGLEAAFAADEAGEMDVGALLEEVAIRRQEADFGPGGSPVVCFELLRFESSAREDWLWRNLEPALQKLSFFAAGNDWPKGLIIHNFMRQWESGAEALGRSLEELIHYHERWLEAAAAGRVVERPDFRRLFADVDRRQQVFPFLYNVASESQSAAQIESVQADLRLLKELWARAEAVEGTGSTRIGAILNEVRTNKEEPYLIFTAYRAVAQAIFEALLLGAPDERVGLVTGEEAVMTGLGHATAQEVVDRFATPGQEKDRIRIMVATDCMSEGVNLQCCSRLILADLPSSPVRLEQRIGRIARPGAQARTVQVYVLRPTRWTDNLGMRRRLDQRLEVARAVGVDHQLAQALQGSAAQLARGSGPLASMTLEERIRGQLLRIGAAKSAPPFARFVGVSGDDNEADLWARVVVKRGEQERFRWLWIPAGADRPVVRLSEQIQGLVKLAEDRRPVEEWECAGPAWEVAQRWVVERRQLFEAARHAPALLGSGSAPILLWRILREALVSEQIALERDEIEELYQRLLGAHPVGIEVEMEEFLQRRPTAIEVHRFVKALPGALIFGKTEVFIVGALYGGQF